MSDSLANETTLEATSEGQSQLASGEQSQGSNEGQTSNNSGQSAKGGKSEKDNISALQSMYDKRIAEMQQTLAQYQNAFAQAQRRMEQLEDAQAPDDYVRMELKAKRAEEKAAQLEALLAQEQQAKAQEQKRINALTGIAAKYGVEVSAIEKATNYEEALEMAIAARDKAQVREAARKQDKEERNMPDVGGGASRTAISEWERQWAEAQANRDSGAMMSLIDSQPKGAKR